MTNDHDIQSKQAALLRILKVTIGKMGKGVAYTTAILGIASLHPEIILPEALLPLAAGIGIPALGEIIERVANTNPSDDEIKNQLGKVFEEIGLSQLVTKDEFWYGYGQLRDGQRSFDPPPVLCTTHRVSPSG